MRKKNVIGLEIAAVLLCLTFFLSISVVFTLNFRKLYYNSIRKFDITSNTGLSEELIRRNYDALIDYNHLFGTKELKLPDFPMSDKGKIHFQEVKQIFITIEWIGIISAIMLCLLIPVLFKKHQYRFLKWNFYYGLSIPIVLGLLIILNWEKAFVLFHKLFFNNDYWIFDINSDPIITILPDEFFFICAISILLLFLSASCISGMIYKVLKVRFYTETDK